MSRSYRQPIIVDGYGTKRKQWEKRFANKTVRRRQCYNGSYYKKLYNRWNICDYKFDYRFEDCRFVPRWKLIRK